MNGNYEFVKHVAREKQSGFANEASVHRMARQAGNPGGKRPVVAMATRAGAWLYRATAEKYVSWKAVPHRVNAAGH